MGVTFIGRKEENQTKRTYSKVTWERHLKLFKSSFYFIPKRREYKSQAHFENSMFCREETLHWPLEMHLKMIGLVVSRWILSFEARRPSRPPSISSSEFRLLHPFPKGSKQVTGWDFVSPSKRSIMSLSEKMAKVVDIYVCHERAALRSRHPRGRRNMRVWGNKWSKASRNKKSGRKSFQFLRLVDRELQRGGKENESCMSMLYIHRSVKSVNLAQWMPYKYSAQNLGGLSKPRGEMTR